MVNQQNQRLPQPPTQQSASGSNDNGQQATSRPKLVFFWNNADVMKWLKRHAPECYDAYGQVFLENEITGRSMVRMTDITLSRMGIHDPKHREELLRIILKLKLKSDILEMKDLESKAKINGGQRPGSRGQGIK